MQLSASTSNSRSFGAPLQKLFFFSFVTAQVSKLWESGFLRLHHRLFLDIGDDAHRISAVSSLAFS